MNARPPNANVQRLVVGRAATCGQPGPGASVAIGMPPNSAAKPAGPDPDRPGPGEYRGAAVLMIPFPPLYFERPSGPRRWGQAGRRCPARRRGSAAAGKPRPAIAAGTSITRSIHDHLLARSRSCSRVSTAERVTGLHDGADLPWPAGHASPTDRPTTPCVVSSRGPGDRHPDRDLIGGSPSQPYCEETVGRQREQEEAVGFSHSAPDRVRVVGFRAAVPGRPSCTALNIALTSAASPGHPARR